MAVSGEPVWAKEYPSLAPASGVSRASVEPSNWESGILAALAFVLSLATAVVLVFHFHIVVHDAFSRVMNAYYTIFSEQFHLAAMGFVWNPLPSLLELPILLLHGVFPSLIQQGFAGNLMSAFSGALCVFYFDRLLTRTKLTRVWRILWTVLFLLNPMILFYFANGMSEALMLGTMMGALDGAISYVQTSRLSSLTAAGGWLGTCFLVRYEAIPFALVLGIAFLFAIWMRGKSAAEMEAELILAAFPLVSAVLLWMMINWMIMGNPLYFLNSSYSNSAQISTGSYNNSLIDADNHHLLLSLQTVAYFLWLFPPVLLGLVGGLFALVKGGWRQLQAVLFLGTTLAIPLFQALMIYKHASAIWDRFFITYIPGAFLMLALLVSFALTWHRFWRVVVLTVISIILIAGNVMTFKVLTQPVLGHGDEQAFQAIQALQSLPQSATTNVFTEGKLIADYINQHSKLVVIMDIFDANGVVPYLHSPKQVVITTDIDFNSVLLNPRGRVNAYLLPENAGLTQLDAINQQYPGMWAGSVSWTHLITSFPGPTHYRLYAVGTDAP